MKNRSDAMCDFQSAIILCVDCFMSMKTSVCVCLCVSWRYSVDISFSSLLLAAVQSYIYLEIRVCQIWYRIYGYENTISMGCSYGYRAHRFNIFIVGIQYIRFIYLYIFFYIYFCNALMCSIYFSIIIYIYSRVCIDVSRGRFCYIMCINMVLVCVCCKCMNVCVCVCKGYRVPS